MRALLFFFLGLYGIGAINGLRKRKWNLAVVQALFFILVAVVLLCSSGCASIQIWDRRTRATVKYHFVPVWKVDEINQRHYYAESE